MLGVRNLIQKVDLSINVMKIVNVILKQNHKWDVYIIEHMKEYMLNLKITGNLLLMFVVI